MTPGKNDNAARPGRYVSVTDFLKANSDEVLADRGEYCEAVGAIAEAVSKSVELIIQPDAHAAPGTSHCIGGGGTDLWPSAWRADFWSTTRTGLGTRIGGGFSQNEWSGCGPRVTWTVCGT